MAQEAYLEERLKNRYSPLAGSGIAQNTWLAFAQHKKMTRDDGRFLSFHAETHDNKGEEPWATI